MPDTIQVRVDEDLKDIVDDYLNNIKEQIQIMKIKLDEKAFDDISAIAHQLKGSGSSYGFGIITESGKKIESAAKECDYNALKDCIHHLAVDLENIDIVFVPEEDI